MQHLLHHTGGWNHQGKNPGDAMFETVGPTEAHFGLPLGSATCANLIEYSLTQPLQFDPGTQFVYSNLGYCVLGHVIQVTFANFKGVPYVSYEKAVRELLLKPAGISSSEMYVGSSVPSNNEAIGYWDATWEGTWPEVQNPGQMVRMEATGGWVATAAALMKFARAITLPYCAYALSGCLLNETSIKSMVSPPPAPMTQPILSNPSDVQWYGLGFFIHSRNALPNFNSWHSGGMPGTSSIFYRLAEWQKSGFYAVALSVSDEYYRVGDLMPAMWDFLECVPDSTWKAIAANGSVSGEFMLKAADSVLNSFNASNSSVFFTIASFTNSSTDTTALPSINLTSNTPMTSSMASSNLSCHCTWFSLHLVILVYSVF